MRHVAPLLTAIAAISFTSIAGINETYLSFQGYSGIINTPNACIFPDGRFSFIFNNQTPPNLENSYPSSFFKNFNITVGMFPCVEIVGRFMNASPSGPRDLSADIKCGYSLNKFNPWLPSIAFGIQDISGGVVYLGTKYLVMSEEIWNLRLSLGYGMGPYRMKGVFYGLEYFVSKYVQLLFDDDGDQTSAALRLSTSSDAPFRTAFTLKSKVNEKSPVFTFSASFSYDLKKRKKPVFQMETFPSGKPDSHGGISENSGGADAIKNLEKRLTSYGIENITVNGRENKLFIRYENNRFGHNEMDALGIVLGAASEISDSTIDTLHITIVRARAAVASIEVDKKDYAKFLETGNGDVARLKIAREPSAEEKALSLNPSNSSLGRVRCELSPRLRYFLGTEVGPLDYQVSLNVDPFIDLWPGARFGARMVLPLLHTLNLDDWNAFSPYREKTKLHSAMLFQFLNIGHGITNLFSTGFYTKYFSFVNDVRFTEKRGLYKIGLNAGYFTFSNDNRFTFLPYAGINLPSDISLLAMYGLFWEKDVGVHFSITRSFNVVDLELFFKRTKNIFDHFDTFVGGQINLPLTFKKGMKPRFITVSGKNDWRTNISTRVAEKGSLNYISTACGVIPEMLLSQDQDFFNRNRLDNRYLNNSKQLLRDTWLENR